VIGVSDKHAKAKNWGFADLLIQKREERKKNKTYRKKKEEQKNIKQHMEQQNKVSTTK